MDPQEVAASYDQIAYRWSSERFDLQNGIAQHRRALSFLSSAGRAIDIGCGGSGRILDLLKGHGLEVEGLDISREMVQLARSRHPDIAFYQDDVCQWKPTRSYVFISAWDSVWHVPLAQQESVLKTLCSALEKDGVIVFTAGGIEEPGGHQDHQMGVPMYHATLGVRRLLNLLYESGCRLRHMEYDQYPEVHVYFIAQRI